jgi:hypothetical protein
MHRGVIASSFGDDELTAELLLHHELEHVGVPRSPAKWTTTGSVTALSVRVGGEARRKSGETPLNGDRRGTVGQSTKPVRLTDASGRPKCQHSVLRSSSTIPNECGSLWGRSIAASSSRTARISSIGLGSGGRRLVGRSSLIRGSSRRIAKARLPAGRDRLGTAMTLRGLRESG